MQELYKLVKETSAWKLSDLDINAKQYVIRKVNDNWKSFCKACKAYAKNKNAFTGQPKMPKYLKHGRCTTLIFDKTRLRHKDLKLNKLSLPKSEYLIQLPNYLQISKIKCITVKEYYGKVKLGIRYEKDVKTNKLNDNKYLGIDIGVDNDNATPKAFIFSGCHKHCQIE